MVYSMLASMSAIISVQSACKLSLHNVTICATIFSRTVHLEKNGFESDVAWTCNKHIRMVIRWGFVLRDQDPSIWISLTFESVVAFIFAHQIQLQFYECRVWFCASNTVTIFMSVALSFAHKTQLQRYIYNIVINFNGHRISCSVSITLYLYDRS